MLRLLRRLKRIFFGDNRFARLTEYAKSQLDRSIIIDDEHLAKLTKKWRGKRINMGDIVGGCPIEWGKSIILSSTLSGDLRIFVLLHELGHAIDFINPERVTLFKTLWENEIELPQEKRELLLSFEERAYELGKELADSLKIDIDEVEWWKYVGRKMYMNIAVYMKQPTLK